MVRADPTYLEGERGWAPKDFKHGRPTLEHLVSLGILERVQ